MLALFSESFVMTREFYLKYSHAEIKHYSDIYLGKFIWQSCNGKKKDKSKRTRTSYEQAGVYKHMCAKVLCERLPCCFSEKDGEVLKDK